MMQETSASLKHTSSGIQVEYWSFGTGSSVGMPEIQMPPGPVMSRAVTTVVRRKPEALSPLTGRLAVESTAYDALFNTMKIY
jgi:hypothetical protein